MKKASIILTTYNRLSYLKFSLNSIRKHTQYPNYQLVVCDDGSTDGTKEFLEDEYKAGNIDELFISKQNLGVTNSRNQGVDRFPADYYCWTDDDTVHSLNWFTEAIKILDEYPEIGAVTTQRPFWELLEEPEKLSILDIKLLTRNNVKAMIVQYIGSCMTIRHDVWDRIGPMANHPHKRSGICRYSNRIVKAKYKVARTYPPYSESIDMPQHSSSLRFSQFKDYTEEVAPIQMQTVRFYEEGIERCRKFDKTHKIGEDGRVVNI